MEYAQYIGIDRTGVLSVCAVAPEGTWRWEPVRRDGGGRRGVCGAGRGGQRGGGGSEPADVAVCRRDHAARGARRRGGYGEDAAQGRLCGQDRSARCAPPGGRLAPGQRSRDLCAGAGGAGVARADARASHAGPREHRPEAAATRPGAAPSARGPGGHRPVRAALPGVATRGRAAAARGAGARRVAGAVDRGGGPGAAAAAEMGGWPRRTRRFGPSIRFPALGRSSPC